MHFQLPIKQYMVIYIIMIAHMHEFKLLVWFNLNPSQAIFNLEIEGYCHVKWKQFGKHILHIVCATLSLTHRWRTSSQSNYIPVLLQQLSTFMLMLTLNHYVASTKNRCQPTTSPSSWFCWCHDKNLQNALGSCSYAAVAVG